MENEFLNEFQDFLLKLPKDQTGNFCDQIDTMLVQPEYSFLHLVCRKIDIKKTLYTSYDEKRDLSPLSMEQLNASYCLKIFYILACFLFCKNSESIRYKALNSLLKLREIMPAECLNNPFAHKIYTKYIKELL